MNPILILIRGIPGSGKSTLAKKISSRSDKAIHLESDMYFTSSGSYHFNPKLLSEAHEWCKVLTEDYLLSEHTVIVSNTFTRLWEMKGYLDLASSLDIPVYVFRMPNEYGSVHNVPRESIDKMKNRFESYENEIIYHNLERV